MESRRAYRLKKFFRTIAACVCTSSEQHDALCLSSKLCAALLAGRMCFVVLAAQALYVGSGRNEYANALSGHYLQL